uniref:Uncharacterized protein n=1 Tax=Cacopsylla melanoneura TaxID=428564 RepID=A0A8D8S459_9HEMI
MKLVKLRKLKYLFYENTGFLKGQSELGPTHRDRAKSVWRQRNKIPMNIILRVHNGGSCFSEGYRVSPLLTYSSMVRTNLYKYSTQWQLPRPPISFKKKYIRSTYYALSTYL